MKERETKGVETIGLIAGWGKYPLVIASALQRQGRNVVCLGIKGHVDETIREHCHQYRLLGLGQLGSAMRFFRRHGVKVATMAGKVHKVALFRWSTWFQHYPDWRFLRTFSPHFLTGTKDCKDDTLLGTAVEAFSNEGITLVPATDFLPEILVPYGVLTRSRPSHREARDIEFGWRLARGVGGLDIGQTVVVKRQAVLAVEAIEGTDECILRAGQLCPSGGFTVVKVAKPQQDMRFDVPTIGVGTLQSMIKARGRVLAVEADRTILVDQSEVVQLAEKHGIAIVALCDGTLDLASHAGPAQHARHPAENTGVR